MKLEGLMKGGMEFGFTFGGKKDGTRKDERTMRILLFADFSGRRNRGLLEPIAGRRPVKIDVDSFDDVIRRLGPRLDLGIGEEVAFASLDEFHPDQLFARLPVFRGMKSLRDRLRDPATFAAAAAELLGPAPPAADGPAPAAPDAGEDTLTRLLGRSSRPDAPRKAPAVDDLIRRAVAPYDVPSADPRLPDCLASLDAGSAAQMRTVLHHEAFRNLEAAWRGAWWVMTGVDADEELSVWLFDATKDEVAADLAAAGGEIEKSGLYRSLVSGEMGDQAWSVLAGAFTFGGSREDVSLLASLGAVASQAGGPFLAGADPELAGCPAFHGHADPTEWAPEQPALFTKLRESPLARWIGLAAPRVLLRVPYGPGYEEIDAFPFVEYRGAPRREVCLWGPAGFAAALLIGLAFRGGEEGWEPGDVLDLRDLPSVAYDEDGEKRLLPCAEAFLPERALQALIDRGLMPIASHKTLNAARLVRFQSIATPAQPLAGPWA